VSIRADSTPFRLLLVAIAALVASVALAACGGDEVGGEREGEVEVAQAGKPTGEITISNWPGYIDPGKNGTVAEFEQQSGVSVNYIEDINDNVQFFGKLQPQLEQGQSGGRSIFVVTDWMAKQMYDLGYLQEYRQEDLPTVFENILPQFETSQYDPERKYSIPWQGGLTGIFVDTSKAPEIDEVKDLFNPKYKGQVTMLTELRDTVPLVLQSQGIDPADATKEDWLAAIDRIGEASESGQIRRFTGNEYTEDLTAGNVVASIGWSGDSSLIGREGVEWRQPKDGCDIFFDQAVIPVGAPNTAAALAFLNFAYRPEVQADITAYVQYLTPVDGVREILTQRDPALAGNELIFPPASQVGECSGVTEPPGSAADKQEVTEAFQDVITG
jgi:spermidine/putrescine transport system substrate-binding protein